MSEVTPSYDTGASCCGQSGVVVDRAAIRCNCGTRHATAVFHDGRLCGIEFAGDHHGRRHVTYLSIEDIRRLLPPD